MYGLYTEIELGEFAGSPPQYNPVDPHHPPSTKGQYQKLPNPDYLPPPIPQSGYAPLGGYAPAPSVMQQQSSNTVGAIFRGQVTSFLLGEF